MAVRCHGPGRAVVVGDGHHGDAVRRGEAQRLAAVVEFAGKEAVHRHAGILAGEGDGVSCQHKELSRQQSRAVGEGEVDSRREGESAQLQNVRARVLQLKEFKLIAHGHALRWRVEHDLRERELRVILRREEHGARQAAPVRAIAQAGLHERFGGDGKRSLIRRGRDAQRATGRSWIAAIHGEVNCAVRAEDAEEKSLRGDAAILIEERRAEVLCVDPVGARLEPRLHRGEAVRPVGRGRQAIEQGFRGRDFIHLAVDDGVHAGVTHGAATMIPPAVDVELREVGVGEKAAIPKARGPPVKIAGGGGVADVVGAPVVVPRRAHAEPSVVTLPRKHADEQPVAVMREGVHDEVVGEVHRVEILAVAIRRIAPDRVVPKHVFELREPALDGGALGRVDLVAAWIVEVQVTIALLRLVVANDLAVGRRLHDAIRTGGVEELRLRRAVRRGPAGLRLGIHAVQTQQPASRHAIRGQRCEIKTVLPAGNFFDDGIDAATVGQLQVAAVLVHERLDPAEAHPILVAGVAIQLVGEGVEQERRIPGAVLVGIIEHPVRV